MDQDHGRHCLQFHAGSQLVLLCLENFGTLLSNQALAGFLLIDAKPSIFWRIRHPDIAEKLHTPLIQGLLKNLSNLDLEAYDLFDHLLDLRFYRQLIKESLSLQAIYLSFSPKTNTSALFLLDAIAHNPMITRVEFDTGLSEDFGDSLKALATVVFTLPRLEILKVTLQEHQVLGLIHLIEQSAALKQRLLTICLSYAGTVIPLVEAIERSGCHHDIQIQLLEDQEEPEVLEDFNRQLSAANFEKRKAFYCDQFSYEEDVEESFRWLNHEMLVLGNLRGLNQLLMQSAQYQKITGLRLAIQDIKNLELPIFQKTLRAHPIQTIEILTYANSLLLLQGQEPYLNLQELGLSDCELDSENSLLQLTHLIQSQINLQSLYFNQVQFKSKITQGFHALCSALEQAPNLRYVLVEHLGLSKAQEIILLMALSKSRTLIAFSLSSKTDSHPISSAFFCTSTKIKRSHEQAVMDACKRNLQVLALSERKAQTSTATLMAPGSHRHATPARPLLTLEDKPSRPSVYVDLAFDQD